MTAHAPSSAAIGRRLREIRVAAGVSLDQLAARAGLRSAILLGIEEGQEQPSIATLEKLAGRLKVSVLDLVRSAGADRPATTRSVEPSDLEGIARAIAGLPATVGDKLEAVELAVVKHAMAVCGGNRTAAARVLGIERKAVIRRWDKVKHRKG